MPLSDAAVVGQPIVAESNFGDGFRDDFDTFDVETASAAGNRTGKWKRGFIHANMAKYGFTYGSDENVANGDNFVHAAINFEDQTYDDTRKPNPSGFNPFSINNSALTITSRLVAGTLETDYARVKGYELNPDGSLGAFLRDHPTKYLSGMISTYGRFAASFARFRWRVKTPYGANGDSADVEQRSAIFPAAGWLLQDVPYGCDINGDEFGDGQTTYRPARPNGGGILAEIDADENFGESATKLHQTVHFHPGGTPQGSSDSSPLTIETGKDLRSEWRITGVDIFPEKIAFHIDGVYTHVVDTPDEIRNGLPKYVPEPGAEYDPVMVNPTTAQTDGRQTHADGSTRYMCFVMISNLARNGKYPVDLARQIVDAGGTLPPHTDTCSMEIDWAECRPLINGNPDNFPMRVNGVPVSVDGSTGGQTFSDLPTRSIPLRTEGFMQMAGGTVPGISKTARFVPPFGKTIDDYTYSWTSGPEYQIIGDASSPEIQIKPLTSPSEGQSISGAINLQIDLIDQPSETLPPVANAGQDATYFSDDMITLTSTGSFDPDGGAITYTWRENGSVIATGPTPTITLPVGTHTIELTVEDVEGKTDTDTVVITVNQPIVNDPPVTITSVSVDETARTVTVFLNNPEGAKIDAHMSSSPQANYDGPYGNDLGDTVNAGAVSSFTFPDTIPSGNYPVYIRVRYTYNDFADNDTTIADGRYADITAQINIVTNGVNTAGMNSMTLPSIDIAEGSFNSSRWATLVQPATSFFWEAGGTSVATVEDMAGYRSLGCRLSPSPSPSTRIGAGAYLTPAQTYRTVQRFYFDPSFDWGGSNEGGKLGIGLAGGSRKSGGLASASDQDTQSGFTSRTMWRTGGSLFEYIYDANTTGYGTDVSLGVTANRGQWYEVAREITMNSSPGASDGTLKIWVDGVLKVNQSNRRWYGANTVNPIQIDSLLMFIFHGGNDSTWSPSRDNHVYLSGMFFGQGSF